MFILILSFLFVLKIKLIVVVYEIDLEPDSFTLVFSVDLYTLLFFFCFLFWVSEKEKKTRIGRI
jgi:hypothetical protein